MRADGRSRPTADYRRAHLADYLPPRQLVPADRAGGVGGRGPALPGAAGASAGRPQRADGLASRSMRFPSVTASAIAAGSLETTCRLKIESVERFSGDIGKVRERTGRGRRGPGGARGLPDRGRGPAARARCSAARGWPAQASCISPSAPAERLPAGARRDRAGLSSGELFHRADLRRPARRRLGRAIDSFVELREGDLVVHVGHGIARYRGMKLLEKDGQVEEHLVLEFQGGTKLYVPSVEDRPGAEIRGRGEEPAHAGQARRPALGPAEADGPRGGQRHGRRDARAAGRPRLAAGHHLPRRYRVAAGVRRLVSLPGDRRPVAAHRGHQARHVACRGRWIACSAATWVTARRSWRCGRRSRRSTPATRWRCSCPPRCWPSSICGPLPAAWPSSPSSIAALSRFATRKAAGGDHPSGWRPARSTS